jgi:hypothetical protein
MMNWSSFVLTCLSITLVHAKCFSAQGGCDDMEMFHQCKAAQKVIHRHVVTLSRLLLSDESKIYNFQLLEPKLDCEASIFCYSKNGICENDEAHQKCKSAPKFLSAFLDSLSSLNQSSILNFPTFSCAKHRPREFGQDRGAQEKQEKEKQKEEEEELEKPTRYWEKIAIVFILCILLLTLEKINKRNK